MQDTEFHLKTLSHIQLQYMPEVAAENKQLLHTIKAQLNRLSLEVASIRSDLDYIKTHIKSEQPKTDPINKGWFLW